MTAQPHALLPNLGPAFLLHAVISPPPMTWLFLAGRGVLLAADSTG